MRLVPPDQVPELDVRRTFRHATWPHVAWLVLLSAPVLAGLFLAGLSFAAWPLVVWVAVVPFALVVGGLLLLVVTSLLGALRASRLPSNWVMKVTPDGAWLQLRSYLNHHFKQAGPTVLFLAFGEIESARRVRERFESTFGGERSYHWRSFLELAVPRLETDRLRTLIAEERGRSGPERRFLGITSRQRHDHVPVFVSGPGLVRVEWRGRAMLAALAGQVALRGPHDEADQPGGRDLESRLRRLVEQGERISAIGIAREEGHLSLTEAKRLIDELSLPTDRVA